MTIVNTYKLGNVIKTQLLNQLSSFLLDHFCMCPNTNDMITFVLLPITKCSSSNHYKYFFFISYQILLLKKMYTNLPDHVFDQQPTIQKLNTHARTADWNRLGVELKLDSVALAGCNDYTIVCISYGLWRK